MRNQDESFRSLVPFWCRYRIPLLRRTRCWGQMAKGNFLARTKDVRVAMWREEERKQSLGELCRFKDLSIPWIGFSKIEHRSEGP